MALVYKGAELEPWTSQHYSFVRKNRSAANNLARGGVTHGLLFLSNHMLYISSVEIFGFTVSCLCNRKKSNLYAILFKNDAKDDCEFPSGVTQKMFVSSSRRKIKLENSEDDYTYNVGIKLPDLPILSLNFMLDIQFSLYHIAIISNNFIMTLIQLQNWMEMEELMGINPGFIFTSLL